MGIRRGETENEGKDLEFERGMGVGEMKAGDEDISKRREDAAR